MSAVTLTQVEDDIRNSLLTQYFGVASFTILVWDHILTFSDEVELIWKGVKGPAVYLFLLNRYLIPLSFIVGLYAYFSKLWNTHSCSHFVRFEGAMTMIGLCVVALMMFLRIRALYQEVWAVQAFVIFLLLAYIGVNSWLLTRGIPVHHVAYAYVRVDSCTMIIDPRVGRIASATAWLPLLYDTAVVGFTLYRTAGALYTRSTGQILRLMLQEGLLYYSVIFTVTLTLAIMITKANQSVRFITAQLELCLTVTMMSRITLHLKRFAHRPTIVSLNTSSHFTRHPAAAAAGVSPYAAPLDTHTHELSVLQAAPPESGWSTVLESGSGSVCESFPFESLAQQSARPGRSVEDRHASLPGDREALDTLSEAGDEGLVGA